MIKCETCNGTRMIEDGRADVFGECAGENCSHCNGDGYWECSVCGGSGEVE